LNAVRWHFLLTFAYNGTMAKKPPSPFPFPPKRVYRGANIPMRVIRCYARAIAEEFHPDKIILALRVFEWVVFQSFGSIQVRIFKRRYSSSRKP
jgi:hypothetical protein